MKPKEIAGVFSEYIEEGTTSKGAKVISFFSHLTPTQKKLVAQNVSKAYASYLEEEKQKAELKQKKKKEIAELKKKAKALGLTIVES